MEHNLHTDEALKELVARHKRGERILPGLPRLEELLEIPEALGFIHGCSLKRQKDGTPLALEKLIGWSVSILAVQKDFQHQFDRAGVPVVEKMHQTHTPAVADLYKMLCGALYASFLHMTPPIWAKPLVQHEGWPQLIEWALRGAGAPHSRVLEEVWKINRYDDLTPWFQAVCQAAVKQLGEERRFPRDTRGL